jgi:D-sedoheptulose 7-phosphate isomerase
MTRPDLVASEDYLKAARWAQVIVECARSGHRLLIAGNGGSAAQASHLAAELVGRFVRARKPLSALSLAADPTILTALSNDFGYEAVFSRQVAAHGRRGDILLLLSTSGRSQNLLEAVRTAHTSGLRSMAMTGPSPNPLAEMVMDCILVSSSSAAFIQEYHLSLIHAMCYTIDGCSETW